MARIRSAKLPGGETVPVLGQGTWRMGEDNSKRKSEVAALRAGMELGMTIDAVRVGHRVVEVELDLSHRATGRTPAGFAHRGRQLHDFVRAYRSRA